MKNLTSRCLAAGLVLVATFSVAQVVRADNNLVLNGDFETISGDASGKINDTYTQIADWDSTGYNFLFASGAADTTGAKNGSDSYLKLWGPNDGSDNGLPASSPTGGNFVAADGAYQVGAISQTVSNLFVGHTYALSFYWGGAQQEGFTGATTEAWKVTLGSESYTTDVADNASHGFTGWMQQTFNFTATTNTEVLSFLAKGTPTGVPPFSVLDGVSMTDTTSPSPTPEPSTIQYAAVAGLFVFASFRRFFRRNVRA